MKVTWLYVYQSSVPYIIPLEKQKIILPVAYSCFLGHHVFKKKKKKIGTLAKYCNILAIIEWVYYLFLKFNIYY